MVQVKQIGNKMVKVEKVFATLEEAMQYARENNKEIVWKKKNNYLV